MDLAADMLMGKPEQEGRLLVMLVNKLGDPGGGIAVRSIELLRKVLRSHPAMKSIVIKEVQQLIYRPGM